jgi:NADH dehydrogenase (ubiquinone) Fe-S protein 7
MAMTKALIVPGRAAAAAAISTSSKRHAGAVEPHGGSAGELIRKQRREVPLPSQEGTKGVVQYAL